MSNASASNAPAAGLSLQVVLLLALAIFINYVDRGSLATAAPLLKDELQLSNAQIGMLLSAFFWSYAPLQLVAGWAVQRWDVRYVYAVGLAIWSLATALTGLAAGFVTLLAMRLLVGVGESVALPCNSQLLATGAQEHERGRANGLIAIGFGAGPAFGTLAGGLLMAEFGWRLGFVVFGLGSLLWIWPWLSATRGTALRASVESLRPPSYWTMLRQRAMWGSGLGHFCFNYGYYFVLTWLPLYLVKARGFSVTQMAVIGSGLYCMYSLSAAFTGWISDRWIVSSGDVNRVRKTFMVTSVLGAAASMLLCASAPPIQAVALLVVSAMFFGMGSPQIFAIAQTLGGARAAGQWTGLQNTAGNIAGIIAPLLTGWLIDRTGTYFSSFMLVGAVLTVGAIGWGMVIPRIETTRWPKEETLRSVSEATA